MTPDIPSELAEIRTRREAAEDTHGKVFFAVTRLLNQTPEGQDLVRGWIASYRHMENLRKQERDIIEHGRIIADGPGDPLPSGL